MMAEEFNHFPELAKQIHDAAVAIVKKAAFDVEAAAKGFAPVRTGFLRNSIYVRTADDSDYGGGADLLPEIEAPESDQEAWVAVGANYGIYLEFGTRFMAAQPYMVPGAEQVRGGFEQAMQALEDSLR